GGRFHRIFDEEDERWSVGFPAMGLMKKGKIRMLHVVVGKREMEEMERGRSTYRKLWRFAGKWWLRLAVVLFTGEDSNVVSRSFFGRCGCWFRTEKGDIEEGWRGLDVVFRRVLVRVGSVGRLRRSYGGLFGESGGGKRRCAGDRGDWFGWWRRYLVGEDG
ncbi:hypothetical protein HAX54_006399, partial [Datura stramonium]|nr:hypothetical protein [Datura stramonium]